jgi:flagellar biosynthesis protein FlhA
LSRDLGFVLPLVQVKDNLALPGNTYRIIIAGVTIGEDEAWPRDLLALDSGDCLDGIAGRPVKDPSFGLDAIWIPAEKRADAIVAGYTVVDPPTVIATHLNTLVSKLASELFGLDEAQALLDALKEACPQLAQGLCPQPYSLAALTSLCRALLVESVPLRDFRGIAEAMVEAATRDLDAAGLVEHVRRSLGALIIQGIAPLRLPLPIMTFDTELETLLNQAVRACPGATWPFEPALAERILEMVRQAAEPMLLGARSFAIVTSPLCRAAVSRLVRAQLVSVPVLSFLEIPEAKAVDIIAVIGGQSDDSSLDFAPQAPSIEGED